MRATIARHRFLAVLAVTCVAVAFATPLWLPLLGVALVDEVPLAPADVALVLDGSGPTAMDDAEAWRQQGLVRDVVIVQAPLRSHALTTYWSLLRDEGLAHPSPTPPEHLSVATSASEAPSAQAQAAQAMLQQRRARSVLIPAGGLTSRLRRREVSSVLAPIGIEVRMSSVRPAAREPARWYVNADDRRTVLTTSLQLLFPFLSGPGSE